MTAKSRTLRKGAEPAWDVARLYPNQGGWGVGDYLVMEVVGKGRKNRERDLVKKRRDYAAAAIPEYWIVDPREKRISVLRLRRNRYLVAGNYGPGQIASSVLLKGFSVSVSEVLAAARRK